MMCRDGTVFEISPKPNAIPMIRPEQIPGSYILDIIWIAVGFDLLSNSLWSPYIVHPVLFLTKPQRKL